MARRRRPWFLIRGPVLLGFAELFDAAYGDPETPRPYVTVTPAAVGRILLPFPCPGCDVAHCDAVDPRTRDDYRDPRRGFSWCPSCGRRYFLDERGAPLAVALDAGAESAPAQISSPDAPARALPGPSGDVDELAAWGVD